MATARDSLTLYSGRLLAPTAAEQLALLAKNTQKSAIVRATALKQLAQYGQKYLPTLLTLTQNKQAKQKAEYALRQAHQLASNNLKILNALVIFYIQQRQPIPANSYLKHWLKISPNNPQAHRLLKALGK